VIIKLKQLSIKRNILVVTYVSLIRSFIHKKWSGLRSMFPISPKLIKYRKLQEKRKYLQL